MLDCSTTSFLLKHKFPMTKDFLIIYASICYMKCSGMIALLSRLNGRICAMSSEGSIVWDIYPQIVGETVSPGRLVYLPDQDLLLLGDRIKRRILVIIGRMGHVVQIISVSVDGWVRDLHVNGNRLIVLSNKQLSFFTVSNKTHLSYRSFYIIVN